MAENRNLFEKELQFLQQNLIHYLNYWPVNLEWRPTSSSFSFLELANHLYTLPTAYAELFKGSSEEELVRLWGGPWGGKTKEDLSSKLISGISDIRSFAHEEHFIPWPFGEPLSPEAHLMNLINHMYHHRGQMHLYLKQLGADVDTGTIYSESAETTSILKCVSEG